MKVTAAADPPRVHPSLRSRLRCVARTTVRGAFTSHFQVVIGLVATVGVLNDQSKLNADSRR